jgi:hypothetical protein
MAWVVLSSVSAVQVADRRQPHGGASGLPDTKLATGPGTPSSRLAQRTVHLSTVDEKMGPVFERMEDVSRRVLVMAQEEARLAGPTHIGTEHLLLGLMSGGIAADALTAAGVSLDPLREQVSQIVALSTSPPGQQGSPPFSHRAKAVLNLAMHESMGRGSSTISPGDLLLGILREGEGVAVQVLTSMEVDLEALRHDVLARLDVEPPHPVTQGVSSGPTIGRQVIGRSPPPLGRIVPGRPVDVCSWCGRDTWEVSHYVSDGSVLICQVCIGDAASAMASAGEDEHRVTLPPRVFGSVPATGAPGQIVRAVDVFMGPEPDGGWGPFVEDADEIRSALLQARQTAAIQGAAAVIRRMRFISPTTAWVFLTVHLGPSLGGFPFEGPVRNFDGSWKVTRELAATMLGAAGIELPPNP